MHPLKLNMMELNNNFYTKEDLITLIQNKRINIWDFFITYNQEFSDFITKTFNECCLEFDIPVFSPGIVFNILKFGIILAIHWWILSATVQATDVAADLNYAKEEYAKYLRWTAFKKDFDTWKEQMVSFNRIFNYFNYGIFTILNTLYSFKRFLFKSPEFYKTIDSKVADFIIDLYVNNKLPPELIEVLLS